MEDWENHEGKTFIKKIIIYKKVTSTLFLTYKASNVKMVSRYLSQADGTTVSSPTGGDTTAAGYWVLPRPWSRPRTELSE